MLDAKWIEKFNEYRSIIAAAAVKWNIPIEIICGVISQESSWNPAAKRYEPAFLRHYVEPVFGFGNKPPYDMNFRYDMATSWGLMQIMGLVAREMGFRGAARDLLDPVAGIEWGCKKLAKLRIKYGPGKDAIASYNAGSPRRNAAGDYVNQHYVDKVLAYAADWMEHIKTSGHCEAPAPVGNEAIS